MAKSYSQKLVFFGGSSLLQFSVQKILYFWSATSRSVFFPWEIFLLTQGNSIYFYLSSSRSNSNGFYKPRIIFILPAERLVTSTTWTLHLSLLPQKSDGLVWVLNSLPEIVPLLSRSSLSVSVLWSIFRAASTAVTKTNLKSVPYLKHGSNIPSSPTEYTPSFT